MALFLRPKRSKRCITERMKDQRDVTRIWTLCPRRVNLKPLWQDKGAVKQAEHVGTEISPVNKIDKPIPTDHCLSPPAPHDGRLEILPLIQTVSTLTIKWQLFGGKKPKKNPESAVASWCCLHQGMRRRRGVPASHPPSIYLFPILYEMKPFSEAHWEALFCVFACAGLQSWRRWTLISMLLGRAQWLGQRPIVRRPPPWTHHRVTFFIQNNNPDNKFQPWIITQTVNWHYPGLYGHQKWLHLNIWEAHQGEEAQGTN